MVSDPSELANEGACCEWRKVLLCLRAISCGNGAIGKHQECTLHLRRSFSDGGRITRVSNPAKRGFGAASAVIA